ncbi:MAG TPA: alpha/beta hydrolase, partial [Verrucomicrobiota bacterium]|nr:alpha/beta hydrolase [Verrucomicrobiota bacterium]
MKTTIRFLFCVMCALTLSSRAQTNSFPLWPDGAPGALGTAPRDVPTLTPFLPDAERASGAAIVICPGGAYQHLADHEGRVYAQWLNEHGVAAFVLKYRLGSDGYRHPRMLEDAARAVRTVRARASEWGIDPGRVGIMGSSAGGHLAATLLTHFDAGDPNSADVIERQSSRPDIGILCYPVITMGPFTHRGSRNNLLGTNAPPELIEDLSNELRVRKDTPPCFIWHTVEDRTVPVENSLRFAEALRAAGVPFELHLYEKGAHGLGLGVRSYVPGDTSKLLPWTKGCID